MVVCMLLRFSIQPLDHVEERNAQCNCSGYSTGKFSVLFKSYYSTNFYPGFYLRRRNLGNVY